MSGSRATTPEDFWRRVNKTSECWHWTGYVTRRGYGKLRYQGRQVAAHRLAYELYNGPVPDGLVLDHTCHSSDQNCPPGAICAHRICVNPDHLNPVTNSENMLLGGNAKARQTYCLNGHEFDEANTYIKPNGCRMCRRCRVAAVRRAKNKERTTTP